jgi:hypothetical protein
LAALETASVASETVIPPVKVFFPDKVTVPPVMDTLQEPAMEPLYALLFANANWVPEVEAVTFPESVPVEVLFPICKMLAALSVIPPLTVRLLPLITWTALMSPIVKVLDTPLPVSTCAVPPLATVVNEPEPGTAAFFQFPVVNQEPVPVLVHVCGAGLGLGFGAATAPNGGPARRTAMEAARGRRRRASLGKVMVCRGLPRAMTGRASASKPAGR